ncbi:MAG: lysyl-tRNA synthetase [candidate division Zixibacteria bacterium SM23_73_2]|nr:MAG: lysyl-tRNA synthetase [candidate division Zixibacteria bacterium SM23_73_2]
MLKKGKVKKESKLEGLPEYLAHRREKLKKLKEKGLDPYPYKFEKTHSTEEILNNFEKLEKEQKEVKIAGRIISLRGHGKSVFFHIQDGYGKIQIYLKSDEVGKEKFEEFDLFDIGDFIGVVGIVFVTKKGEKSIRASDFVMLSKSLRPLPEKWHGLQDKELRYRQRYLDLIVNPEVKKTFLLRTKIIQAMRKFLDDRGFIEVETPILQPIYGGASARPFKTYHNTLERDLYLRIADELYLKRLLIGGFEKVYEVCKDFRNEGMDKNHNPEFSMLELYQAYADYNDIMKLEEELMKFIAQKVSGKLSFTYQGDEINLDAEWRRIPILESIKEYAKVDLEKKDEKEIREITKDLNLSIDEKANKWKLVDTIFGNLVQPYLVQPTFITDYPTQMSPLAKKHRKKEGLTERFELFIGGLELGNAFSELNDPLDQRERFSQQMELRDLGDEEAQVTDEDFLRALEHGMPPTGGLGIGIDRVVMLFTDSSSIRDVIFFPQMRPEA